MKKNIGTGLLAVAIVAAVASSGFAWQLQLGEIITDDVAPRVANLQQEEPYGDLPDGPGEDADSAAAPQSALDAMSADIESLELEQSVEVNERYAGWESAGFGTNGNRISDVLRANWVMADSNGRVVGTVATVGDASLENMQVYLLNKGRVVTSSSVFQNGNFEFTNVIQGPYSLVGVGPNGFFAFGLNILRHTDGGNQDVPKRIDVAAFQNKTTINHDWLRYFAPNVKFRVFGRYSSEEGPDDPASRYGTSGLANYKPSAAAATSISNHRVAKAVDGRFVGRIHQFNSLHGRPVDVQRTRIMLLQNDGVVASTSTDNYGVFEIAGVAAGEYALVAAGTDGLGTIGVTIVESGQGSNPYSVVDSVEDEPGEDDEEEDSILNGTDSPSEANVFDFTLASAETVGWLNHYAIDSSYRRAILAPRRPYVDPDAQQFGCGECGAGFNMGTGNKGRVRRAIDSVNDRLDNIFYPQDGQQNQFQRPCNNCSPNAPGVGFGGPLFSADGTPIQTGQPTIQKR